MVKLLSIESRGSQIFRLRYSPEASVQTPGELPLRFQIEKGVCYGEVETARFQGCVHS